MKVKLEDIIEAIEFTSDDIEYFLDQETGEIVMISDMTMTSEEKEEACEALDAHGFYRLPTQWELRDYDTMEAFVTLFFFAISLWVSSKNARTAGIADTLDAYIDISGVRILSPGFSPLRYTFCLPSSYFTSILISLRQAVTPSASSGDTSCCLT